MTLQKKKNKVKLNQSNMKRAVLSLSGGMDSTSLALKLLAEGYELETVSFDYGQRHRLELERAEQLVKYMQEQGYKITYNCIDLRTVGKLLNSNLLSGNGEVPKGHYESDSMKATVVPNRNVIFSAIVYGVALSLANRTGDNVEIALGVHSGDHAIYPDCRQESVDALRHAFSISNWDSEKVTYITPFVDLDKTQVLKEGFDACEKLNAGFYEVMKRTSTSYQPTLDGKADGRTGSDVERVEAFLNLGLVDPIEYKFGWDETVKYVQNLIAEKDSADFKSC
jgi:7-cyano-7-deazaguanine synthase